MIRVSRATVVEKFVVRLVFTDGAVKTADLEPYLRGPIFEPLREPGRFRELGIDPELGTIVWPNGADLCADVLYHGRLPAAMEETPQ